MPRGGYRAGAGRPKSGFKKLVLTVPDDYQMPIQNQSKDALALDAGLMPLDYLLSVVRDTNADPLRRDRLAIAVAPYCHPKVADSRVGKKDLAEQAAGKAGQGTEWGDDLQANVVRFQKV